MTHPVNSVKRRPGRPPGSYKKVTVSLRLDPDIVEALRATGPNWQMRINMLLRSKMKQHNIVLFDVFEGEASVPSKAMTIHTP
jgi:uncharacterized protein (DUF4415 family)